jgi:hypothetical protein
MVNLDTLDMDNLELFWYWIEEREIIRILKEKGCQPEWTEDPILQTYHFCNVRREDDRGTKEIRLVAQTVLAEELPRCYTLGRMFNSAETLKYVLALDLKGADWAEMLCEQMDIGNKVFHTAYVVSTCGVSMPKPHYVRVVADAVGELEVPRVGLGAAHQALMSVNGLGSFLAAQVVADLRNDRYLWPENEVEGKFWSAMGPGSKKGLDFLFSTPTNGKNYQNRMEHLFRIMPNEIQDMNLHAQDLQNCLCEFSKYMRHTKKLGGRVRYYDH